MLACDSVSGLCGGADQTVLEGERVSLVAELDPAKALNVTSWDWTARRENGTVIASDNDADFWFDVPDNGSYTATVTVRLADGGIVSDEVAITADNVRPTLSISGASTVTEGAPYALALKSFDPGTDTISSWTINWGDGTPSQTLPGNPTSASHVYADGPNRYAITASAADEDGSYAAAQGEIEVTSFDATFGNAGIAKLSFTTSLNGITDDLLVLPDGKIIAVGRAASNNVNRPVIARFNANGSLDTTYGNGGTIMPDVYVAFEPVHALLDSQQRLLLVGYSEYARFTANGQLDTSFGDQGVFRGQNLYPLLDSHQNLQFLRATVTPNGVLSKSYALPAELSSDYALYTYTLDAQDRMILTGYQGSGSSAHMVAVRLTSDRQLDPTFGAGGIVDLGLPGYASSSSYVAVQSGEIVIGGWAQLPGQSVSHTLTRLLDNGALDNSFGAGGRLMFDVSDDSYAATFELASDGGIYCYGEFGWIKFDSAGVLTESASTPLKTHAIAEDGAGNLLIGGSYFLNPGSTKFALARQSPAGTLDTAFARADTHGVSGLAMLDTAGAASDVIQKVFVNLPDGGLLVGGISFATGSQYKVVLVRYTTAGVVDASFGNQGSVFISAGSSLQVHGLTVDSAGRILVLIEGEADEDKGVLRFLADGTPDNSFGAGDDNWARLPQYAVRSLDIDPDGNLIVAGTRYQAEDSGSITITKLNGNTGLPIGSFGSGGTLITKVGKPDSAAFLTAATLDAAGRIVVSGDWLIWNPDIRDFDVTLFVARFTKNGALDPTFGVGATYDANHQLIESVNGAVGLEDERSIGSLVIDHQQRIVSAGSFGAVRLTAAGVLDATFGNQGHVDLAYETHAIAVDALDRLATAGDGLARYTLDGQLDESFAPGGRLFTSYSETYVSLSDVRFDKAGRLLIGGQSINARQGTDFYLARVVPSNAEFFVDVLDVGPQLSCLPLVVGDNVCTMSNAKPGVTVSMAMGLTPGSTVVDPYNVTVDMEDPQIVTSAMVAADGTAVLHVDLNANALLDRVFLQAFEQTAPKRVTNVVIIGSPLRSADGQGSSDVASNVSPALRAEAIARWAATGLTAAQIQILRAVSITMTDLPSDVLGQTIGKRIYLDATAAGHGWYVDATPKSSSEFDSPLSFTERKALGTSEAAGKVDLLTVLMHEYGHVLGLADLSGEHDLMSHDVALSTRRLPPGAGEVHPFDIDRDGQITPVDALLIINSLNAVGARPLLANEAFYDASGDNFLTPLDALLVINHLNALGNAQGEASVRSETAAAPVDDLTAWWWLFDLDDSE